MARETKLERIAREIADARRIVGEKRASVAWLKARGRPAEEGENLLRMFEAYLADLEARERKLRGKS